MTVLRAGRRKELLARIEMDAPLYSRPALVGDALYLATANRLYLIAAKGLNPVSRGGQNTTHVANVTGRPSITGTLLGYDSVVITTSFEMTGV
jgi:hypothetical protein